MRVVYVVYDFFKIFWSCFIKLGTCDEKIKNQIHFIYFYIFSVYLKNKN